MAKTKLTKQFIEDSYNWIRENGLIDYGGAKLIEFCHAMGISYEAYYDWTEGKQVLSIDFIEAIKRAKEEFKENLVKDLVISLAKSAKGYTWTKTKTQYKNVNGKPQIMGQTKEEMNVPPNVGAAIFLLTNIAPDKWQNRQYIDSRETKETKIKVDADAEILDTIPTEVLADITESLQLAIEAKNGKSNTSINVNDGKAEETHYSIIEELADASDN